MSDFNVALHAWQVLDHVHYVVCVVDLDESVNGDRTALLFQNFVAVQPDYGARVWLGEVLLAAVEEL